MKHITKFLSLVVLAFGLFVAQAHATIKSVTTVGASASTISAPAQSCSVLVIQNNGAGAVRISIDGGTTNAVPTADPTASTGILLPAGQQVTICYFYNQRRAQIRAILVTGTTTTLDIATDDTAST